MLIWGIAEVKTAKDWLIWLALTFGIGAIGFAVLMAFR